MHSVVPHAKLILLVREPVARAYSHWNHLVQTGGRSRQQDADFKTFGEALEADRDWMTTRSMYATHLAAILELFPREQVHIEVAERIRTDAQPAYDRLFEFLGVTPRSVELLPDERANVRTYSQRLDAADHRRWSARFNDEVERLRSMLGDPIPEWELD